MNSIELTFDNPWLLLVAIPAVAVVLFPFFLLPPHRRKSIKRLVPLVLHIVLVLILTLMMAGFHIIRSHGDQAVILLVDMSQSTKSVQKNIRGHANALLDKIDEDIPVGVVVFGGTSENTLAFTTGKRNLMVAEVDAGATDLAGAMEYAATLAPADKSLRMILLTDGKQTDGDADSMAYKLASRGVRLDAVYYDTTELPGNEMQIASFTGPRGVYKGKKAVFLADIKSNYDGNATLCLYDGNVEVWKKDCEMKKGSNLHEIEIVCDGVGAHSYRLELSPKKDTYSQNNEAICCLSVAGEPSVLIIADNMADAISVRQMLIESNDVSCTLSMQAPTDIVQLCKYDGVILSNVQYYNLPRNYDRILESYVADYGRGLLAVGGRNSFMFGNMQNTRIENLLPVEMVLEEDIEGKSVALMLVLDCSGSMEGENIRVAKQGAIKCMDVMSSNDYVGLVSFDSKAQLAAALMKATDENKAVVSRAVSELRVGSGTYYCEALTLAYEELSKSNADVKHILFLSDGQPSDSGYYDIVLKANEEGITVSTIGLGFSSAVLDRIATHGKGRYYTVSSEEKLPDVMLSETEHARANPLIVRDTKPVIQKDSELTDFMSGGQLPNLGGYLGTTLKTKATAYITSPEGHPLYAAWNYGFGKVSCFTSDLHGEWSASWHQSNISKKLVSNMISSTVSGQHCTTTLNVALLGGGTKGKLTVTTAATALDNVVSIVVGKGQGEKTYGLWQSYPGMFETEIALDKAGTIDFTVVETTIDGRMVDSFEGQLAVPYSKEYDAFASSGRGLLAAMCAHSEGEIFNDLGALAKVRMPRIRTMYDPVTVLAWLAALILLADIAVRKIRWKDIKALVDQIRYRLQKKY